MRDAGGPDDAQHNCKEDHKIVEREDRGRDHRLARLVYAMAHPTEQSQRSKHKRCEAEVVDHGGRDVQADIARVVDGCQLQGAADDTGQREGSEQEPAVRFSPSRWGE